MGSIFHFHFKMVLLAVLMTSLVQLALTRRIRLEVTIFWLILGWVIFGCVNVLLFFLPPPLPLPRIYLLFSFKGVQKQDAMFSKEKPEWPAERSSDLLAFAKKNRPLPFSFSSHNCSMFVSLLLLSILSLTKSNLFNQSSTSNFDGWWSDPILWASSYQLY